MFNIVLVHPQIPPNTGNIGRICVNTGATLHLVRPIGFDIDDKSLKRAGLDYWRELSLVVWEDLAAFLEVNPDPKRFFFSTTKSQKPYFEAVFKPGDTIFFGSETTGLPMELMQKNWDHAITIPMARQGRSLNLAVSVGIILYEAIRQNFSYFKEQM